jgi:hypothetical protein
MNGELWRNLQTMANKYWDQTGKGSRREADNDAITIDGLRNQYDGMHGANIVVTVVDYYRSPKEKVLVREFAGSNKIQIGEF